MSGDLKPGWFAEALRDAAAVYRAVEFAKSHPDVVNKMADEMKFKAPTPQLPKSQGSGEP
jgi:hypothetical protein